LILTVVVSVLLALIAVLFILRTSVDSVGTLSVSDNKELSFAVDTMLTQLKYELTLDVPGIKTLAQPNGQEYQDYPWDNGAVSPADPVWKRDDRWLACLEPFRSGTDYYWGHISDLYGDLGAAATNNVVKCAVIVDGDSSSPGKPADADGDGIADSRWVKAMAGPGADGIYGSADDVPLLSSRGAQVYLALRVIDLGGMLNANTAYRFDPTNVLVTRVDGSSVTQINLFGLALRSTSGANNIGQLEAKWQGAEPLFLLSSYENQVVRRLGDPLGLYTPFGIGEELKLRYRYILNQNYITTRMDNNPFGSFWAMAWENGISVPSSSLSGWYRRVTRRDLVPAETLDPNDPNSYDYRHLTTTFNCDRLIDPNGQSLTNINTVKAQVIYDRLRVAMPAVDPNIVAQLAVNIKDYRDGDNQVSRLDKPDKPGDPNFGIYGHSSPFMWISEVAYSYVVPPSGPDQIAYAVELYIPRTVPPATDYRLRIGASTYAIPSSASWAGQFYVLQDDPDSLFAFADPNVDGASLPGFAFSNGDLIELQRLVLGTTWVTVDSKIVPVGFIPAGAVPPISLRRDISDERALMKDWDPAIDPTPSLGVGNGYVGTSEPMQYFTKDADFTTIGELGNVLKKATNDVGPLHSEADVRLDWTVAPYGNIARYFTVMTASPVAGKKVYGRVNINTAPYFVIAQLPWMQYSHAMASTDPNRFARARDVVARRDDPAVKGFPSISDVLLAPRMQDLAVPPDGQLAVGPPGSPDFSSDNVPDDFEERDVIFSRISNVATVRSDVFCAYILLRLGENGPQKRMMVILDRSDVTSAGGKVRIRAIQPVADPR